MCRADASASINAEEAHCDAVLAAVYEHAALPLRNTIDLAYPTRQRPAEGLRIAKQSTTSWTEI